ncbi:MAG TPA: alpha/beta fold hydrolase [Candidatus Binatia bacterium]|nr:alpha/beta fold hydrolase [Candidatus Binatia bacterium]
MIAAVGLYGTTVYLLQKSLSHRVEKLKYIPHDLGLQGESRALTSSDGIPLKAWWIPADPARGAVVVLHGMDGLDASCVLPQAKFLHDAGWSALVLDMRAHGRSGGNRIGLSVEEPRDVSAALDWLQTQPSLQGKPLVLLGLSMGGATAIRTAAVRHDVDAVISVSSFASFEPFMGKGMELWLGRLAILTLYGVWTPNVQPVREIGRIPPRPVLIMHGSADRQIPVGDALLLKQAGGPDVQLWIAPGADHLIYTEDGNGAGALDTGYRTHILDFLAGLGHRG